MNVKRILIAMDTSENSAKAVNYVAGMIGGGKDFFVELLSVYRVPDRHIFREEAAWKEKYNEEKAQIRAAMERARKDLVAGGLTDKQVKAVSFDIEQESIADAIIDHGLEGDFGTLVVGRRGVSKSEEVMFGSVSKRVVTHARECAVWVVE